MKWRRYPQRRNEIERVLKKHKKKKKERERNGVKEP